MLQPPPCCLCPACKMIFPIQHAVSPLIRPIIVFCQLLVCTLPCQQDDHAMPAIHTVYVLQGGGLLDCNICRSVRLNTGLNFFQCQSRLYSTLYTRDINNAVSLLFGGFTLGLSLKLVACICSSDPSAVVSAANHILLRSKQTAQPLLGHM